ncbi:MAG TPA: ABC transporter substrate-binding protein [Candidatus Limnocylindrales bacterium]|nr:ABC transporter substrate-binding protein [Candidatus Limnocylindrales bacterium]
MKRIKLYGVKDPNISSQLILAKEKGFFDEEGLQVEYRLLPSGTIMPDEVIQAKEKPFAFTQTPVTTLILQDRGLDVKIVAPLADISGTQQVVIREDSGIVTPRDLEGKKIGMAQGAAVYIALQSMAREFGVDLTRITFVDLLPAQQLEALQRGEIDGMACWEPWTSRAQAIGGKFYFSGSRSAIPGYEEEINWLVDQSVLMVLNENLQQHPDTVKALIRAFKKATDFINENPEEAAMILSGPLSADKIELDKILALNKYSMKMDNLFKIGLLSFRELLFQNGVISTMPEEKRLYTTEWLEAVEPSLVLITREGEVVEEEENEEFLEIFFEEAGDILEGLEKGILALEKAPGDRNILRNVITASHTLKGNSGFLGFEKINSLSRHMEETLKAVQKSDGIITQGLITVLFNCLDTLRRLVNDYKTDKTSPLDLTPLLTKINQLVSESLTETAVSLVHQQEEGIELIGYEEVKLKEAQEKGKRVFRIEIEFAPDWSLHSAGAFMVTRKLSRLGEVIKVDPPLGSGELKKTNHFQLILASSAPEELIQRRGKVAAVVQTIRISPFALPSLSETHRVEVLSPGSEPVTSYSVDEEFEISSYTPVTSTPSAKKTLRVDYQLLDEIMNVVGELVIGGATLSQGLSKLNAIFPTGETARLIEQLMKTNTLVRKNLLNLQENIMKVRMMPIDVVFKRFPRLVRDLALKKGKEVKLEITGEHTELDKAILDLIGEPLTKLLRSIVEYGIEPPSLRAQLGKPTTGRVSLNSYHAGNQIIIEISDDGRGTDLVRVKNLAVEHKFFTPEEAENLSISDLFNVFFNRGLVIPESEENSFLFGPGIQSARKVIEELNGTLEVESQLNKGTRFIVKLPLTLAIIQALLLEIGNRVFAIPLSLVVEVLRISTKNIEIIGKQEVFQLRGQVIHLLRPYDILGVPPPKIQNEKLFVVVVRVARDELVGIVTDQPLEKEELVIKSLDTKIVKTDIISSASKLGDGRVILILDVPALISKMYNREY